MNGEDWYDVRHGRLIITPSGSVIEEDTMGMKREITGTPLFASFVYSLCVLSPLPVAVPPVSV